MKKYLHNIFVLFIVLWIIIGYFYFPSNIPMGTPSIYTVKSIQFDDFNPKQCKYGLQSTKWYYNIDNRINIYDTIGKFNINDTITFTAKK